MSLAPLTAPPPLRVLLAGAIDYAGLFPPAELDLSTAVANYLVYRESSDAWALGRFVVPVSRLRGLEDVLRMSVPLTAHLSPLTSHLSLPTSHLSPLTSLPLTAVLGPGTADDVDAIEEFNRRAGQHGARVESIEAKASSEAAVRAVLAGIPPGWKRYLEIPLGEGSEAALAAVAAGQAFAKVRTGGITVEAIPSPDQLLQFLGAAARGRIPFKATAGLHHPLRGSYRVSYAPDAPSGTMYGYLNLLLAAAVFWTGGALELARAALLEADPRTLRFEGSVLAWRALRIETERLMEIRRSFFHTFGSCSFREPVDELAAGGWL